MATVGGRMGTALAEPDEQRTVSPATRAHVVLAGRLANRIGGALRPPCEVAT